MIEVIAEIGVNHNGDFLTACKLVDAAISCGCSAVKTQLWNSERVYRGDKIAEMKKLELSRRQISDLNAFCRGRGVELIVTPDEYDDAVFLKKIGLRRIKTSSQDVTNQYFLKQIGELGLPVIYSTGACNWPELFAGYQAIRRPDTTILHCVSAYPAPLEETNMRVLKRLIEGAVGEAKAFGLSDHSIGNEAAVMALALGATVFERHLTLDRDADGPDHASSMTPDEMWFYVQSLRRCEAAMGDGDKRVMPCEQVNRAKFEAFRGRPFNAATEDADRPRPQTEPGIQSQ